MDAAENGSLCGKTNQICLTSMFESLKRAFAHPLSRGLNIDSPEATRYRRQIIQDKAFLRQLYAQWYGAIGRNLPRDAKGPVVELGTGGGFLADFIPGLITSELFHIPNIDLVADGQCLPFKNASLKAVVMVDVFHHMPHVAAFLAEAARCVKPNGAVIMIEPWVTPWSTLVYKYLHHEPFDSHAGEWSQPKGGPLSQANAALPWIVFQRDRKTFQRFFPEWDLKHLKLTDPFGYLLSGGVSLRSFLPGMAYRICRRIEARMMPWMDRWAMFAQIILIRRQGVRPLSFSRGVSSPLSYHKTQTDQ